MALFLSLAAFVVFNANMRSISAGDTYSARYLPFSIWQNQSLTLDPILTMTAQGRNPPATTEKDDTAHWIVKAGDHYISRFPVVVPVILAPLYLPAFIYLQHHDFDPLLFDKVARVMEKLCASLLAALSVGLLYLLLRRRTGEFWAFILSLVYAFGTTTWVISSQALWMHGLAQVLIVATMLLLTGPGTGPRAVIAGMLCGLIAANRQPDAILAAGLGLYGLWWAGRKAPLFVLAGLVPVGLVVAYNLLLVGNVMGAYAARSHTEIFNDNFIEGVAGLLVSPTRGLFVFSPFLLFLVFFIGSVAREPLGRGLTLTVGCAIVVQVLFYAMIDWRQGTSWGPRWLTDMLPMLIWMLPPVLTSLSKSGRVAFGTASFAAVMIQAIGAFWYTGVSDLPLTSANGPEKMRPAWDFRNAAFIAELSHPPVKPDLVVDLRGSIDITLVLPVATGASERQMSVQGWALTNGRSPTDVAILVDGKEAGGTDTFFARSDVEAALGETNPAGWAATANLKGLEPGEHILAAMVRATPGGEPRLLKQTTFVLEPEPDAIEPVSDLPSAARHARQMLERGQRADGSWLTSFTGTNRFQEQRPELNTYLNAIMLDVAGPVADMAGIGDILSRARRFLAAQIEENGLVRYHGLPDAPAIGVLGCAITPDSDDTALTWRVSQGGRPEQLASALATLKEFRRPDGLYKTWLAPRDRYQCLDPGQDPNPADVGIQMHIFQLLDEVDKPAARALCEALSRKTGDDDIWVYYAGAPVVVILRLAELRKAGCTPQFPQARLRTEIPGQEIWVQVANEIARMETGEGSQDDHRRREGLLNTISDDDFSLLKDYPPLLYHNDPTATVSRFYWSQDIGYALWLRLYLENEQMKSALPCNAAAANQRCGEN